MLAEVIFLFHFFIKSPIKIRQLDKYSGKNYIKIFSAFSVFFSFLFRNSQPSEESEPLIF